MTKVCLSKNGHVQEVKVFEDFMDALREYKRQARNAWRRKRAFEHVEFPLSQRMSWYEFPGLFSDADHYYLEIIHC